MRTNHDIRRRLGGVKNGKRGVYPTSWLWSVVRSQRGPKYPLKSNLIHSLSESRRQQYLFSGVIIRQKYNIDFFSHNVSSATFFLGRIGDLVLPLRIHHNSQCYWNWWAFDPEQV